MDNLCILVHAFPNTQNKKLLYCYHPGRKNQWGPQFVIKPANLALSG